MSLSVRNPKTDVYQVLSNEESFGSALFVATCHIIPIDTLSQMSIDTVVIELAEEAKFDLTDTVNLFKLQAAMAVMFDPVMFYEDVVGFIDICNALSGTDIDPDTFDPADPFEMSWAIAEAAILDPPDPGEERWSEDIRRYMGMTLSEYGHLRPPFNMSMAKMPEGVNPAMELSDQPEMVTAATGIQDVLNHEVKTSVQARLQELRDQLAPFHKQS